jgi:hypothetical protein
MDLIYRCTQTETTIDKPAEPPRLLDRLRLAMRANIGRNAYVHRVPISLP